MKCHQQCYETLQVGINDRVIYTGQFGISNTDSNPNNNTGSELDLLLKQANASAASFFANAIDTESRGLDVVITHDARIGDNAKLKTDLSGTLSKTKKIHLYKSKAYKSYVVSFDLGSSKKFIITKEKWLVFRNHIEYIDEIMFDMIPQISKRKLAVFIDAFCEKNYFSVK